MNKKISLGAAIAFMLIVATATFSMTMIYATNQFNEKVNDLKRREVMFEKFSEINTQVRQNFYWPIDETLLMDSVANGFIEGLDDQYSQYYDAIAYERMSRSDEGNIVGIGADLRVGAGGYLEVERVYTDSPAQAANMEPGDLIIRIDDEDVTLENSAQMLQSVQGEPGTSIILVFRRGTEETSVTMTRRQVVMPTVSSRFIPEDGIGYIRIDEFGDNTSDQFNRELQRMIDEGAQSLVIDLRDNPGGRLRWAARILDRLLPAGPIASSSDRNNNIESLYTSDANEIDLPMVVVTNSGTASAAELFAQAIKDYGKGRTVGSVTAGKGVIQEVIRLSDGSAINLTVGLLLPPNGESFNGIGIPPDYEVAFDGEWQELDEVTDPQLKLACEVAVALQKSSEALEQSQADGNSSEADGASLDTDGAAPGDADSAPQAGDTAGDQVEDESALNEADAGIGADDDQDSQEDD